MVFCNSPKLPPYSPDFSKTGGKKEIDLMGKEIHVHKLPLLTDLARQEDNLFNPIDFFFVCFLLLSTVFMIAAILPQSASVKCFHCEQFQ